MKKIKVLHIITCLDIGGSEKFLSRLVSRMNRDVFESTVINLSPPGPLVAQLEGAGIRVISLGVARRKPWRLFAFLRLPGIVRSLSPDLIQTWLYHSDFVGVGLRLLFPSKRLIWNIRCSQMDFSRYFFVTRWLVRLLSRFSQLPEAIVHNSEAGRREHEKLGYRSSNWALIENGLDTDIFSHQAGRREGLRRELGLSPDILTIGMVARFDPMKDFETLIMASRIFFPSYPKAKMVLIGRGVVPENITLDSFLATHFILLGERHDIPELLSTMDIFTLSSKAEGFPNALVEAMACGIPCVATDVGDAKKIVGTTGVVVPPENPEKLAAGWLELASRPSEERAHLGREARQRIKGLFSIELAAKKYEHLYLNVTNKLNSELQTSEVF